MRRVGQRGSASGNEDTISSAPLRVRIDSTSLTYLMARSRPCSRCTGNANGSSGSTLRRRLQRPDISAFHGQYGALDFEHFATGELSPSVQCNDAPGGAERFGERKRRHGLKRQHTLRSDRTARRDLTSTRRRPRRTRWRLDGMYPLT